MKSHLSTKDLSAIRKRLPYGSIKKISEQTGLDQSTVSKVIKGDFRNDAVIDCALTLIELDKQKSIELRNRISKI